MREKLYQLSLERPVPLLDMDENDDIHQLGYPIRADWN